jgi:hypothetical protein
MDTFDQSLSVSLRFTDYLQVENPSLASFTT